MGFFKAYDMRGTFGTDFGLETVYGVGRRLPAAVGGKRWLAGRDCRTTSADVKDALVRGLSDAGADVVDIGLCTTPMVYFFTAEDGFDGSVMVTASHNPPGDNGLKVSRSGALPVGYADGLDRIEAALASGAPAPEAGSRGAVSDGSAGRIERYVAWQRAATPAPRSLRYAVDCSNGMAALLADKLFPGALILNGTPDGRFPAHSPNPLSAEAREQISETVRREGFDCGIVFDGDADRAMFVDENGGFVQPDLLIPAVAAQTAKRGDKVIHDVRTSRGALRELARLGFEPVMVPVGHAFAKPILRKTGASCGGELAGHYYFSEFHCCDSGVLAALRILAAVAAAKSEGKTMSAMMKSVTDGWWNSGELNFRVEDKDAAIGRALDAAARKFPEEISRSLMDGIRVEYAEGWINIRKSNTEPYLRLIAECDSPARLEEWKGILSEAIVRPGLRS